MLVVEDRELRFRGNKRLGFRGFVVRGYMVVVRDKVGTISASEITLELFLTILLQSSIKVLLLVWSANR